MDAVSTVTGTWDGVDGSTGACFHGNEGLTTSRCRSQAEAEDLTAAAAALRAER